MKFFFRLSFAAFIALLLLSGCRRGQSLSIDNEPFIELAQEQPFPVYFTVNDELHKANAIQHIPVYKSPNGANLSHPRINYQRNKVACIDNFGNVPIILDMDGNLIARVDQARNASEICWSADGNSLVVIRDFSGSLIPPFRQDVFVWGDPYDPPFDRSILSNDKIYLDVLAISADNHAAWGIYDETSSASWRKKAMVTLQGPNATVEVESFERGNRVKSLSFSQQTHELVATFFDRISFDISWETIFLPITATSINDRAPWRFGGSIRGNAINNEGNILLSYNNNGNSSGYRNTVSVVTDTLRNCLDLTAVNFPF
jgi:hypothetical protein